MLVLSNRRLGPGVEVLVSDGVAACVLHAIAGAAAPFASNRWEHELVRWLEGRATATGADERRLDVGDIAWSPEHFESQRRFLIEAILRASIGSEHTVVLDRWRRLVEAHPAESVQVGRRWIWQPTA